MSRPIRSERSHSHGRGRPKRRAASTHLFKYQLAGDPGRIEDNALKKALQESLEEHESKSGGTVVTPKISMNQNSSKCNRVINSSTNSSDLSRTTNNSSSTSSDTRDSVDGVKRTGSSMTSPITTQPSSKRAKLTNGHKKIATNQSSKGDICDIDSSVLSGSPQPSVNKAIRTYSRSQQVNGQHDSQLQRNSPVVNPRSSTPIVKIPTMTIVESLNSEKSEPARKGNQAVSRSTQTTLPKVNKSNSQIVANSLGDKDLMASSSPKANDGKIPETSNTPQSTPPIQEQYLKFKRESKNYAYAKMTALQVNTFKPLGSNPKSSKKTSPTGILNNNTNKIAGKSGNKVAKNPCTNSNSSSNSNSNQSRSDESGEHARPKNGKKSLSPILRDADHHDRSSPGLSRTTSNHAHGKPIASKSILKHSSALPQMLNNDPSLNITSDLSDTKNQNQTNVSVTKKRIAQGSWSLLGVPEEKVVYLRDDEPPRRLICYPAIKHIEGDVIQVRDSVLLRSGVKKTDLPYIAKVCAFWEDAETGGVRMSLFWYYRPEHTEEGRKPHHLPDEIFASRHRDVDTVECIEDKCYVLTFNEYCRYRKRVKMEQVSTSWSLSDVTIPLSNESYPRRNRIPDTNVNPELVFCCRQIYDSRMRRLLKNPHINPKYGHI